LAWLGPGGADGLDDLRAVLEGGAAISTLPDLIRFLTDHHEEEGHI
jgi:hypothetical protein